MSQFWDIVCPHASLSSIVIAVAVIITCWILVPCIYKDKKLDMLWKYQLSLLLSSLLLHLWTTIVSCQTQRLEFKRGVQTKIVPCLVQRPAISRKLKGMLRPDDCIHRGRYYLLQGPHGCGKTTILMETLAEYGSGVLYVPMTSYQHVSTSLYSALKISDYCKSHWATIRAHFGVPSGNCPDKLPARPEYALEILVQTVKETFSEDNYPPSVVFDHTARMLQYPDGADTIHILQGLAN